VYFFNVDLDKTSLD